MLTSSDLHIERSRFLTLQYSLPGDANYDKIGGGFQWLTEHGAKNMGETNSPVAVLLLAVIMQHCSGPLLETKQWTTIQTDSWKRKVDSMGAVRTVNTETHPHGNGYLDTTKQWHS